MLVDGHWVPTFPNARYLFGRDRIRVLAAPRSDDAEQQVDPSATASSRSSTRAWPIWWRRTTAICPEIGLEPTLGHTPGHVSVRIRSKGEEALITGDFIHHPCQLAHPEWASLADYDEAASTATRQRMFAGAGRLAGAGHRHPFRRADRRPRDRDGEGYRLEV